MTRIGASFIGATEECWRTHVGVYLLSAAVAAVSFGCGSNSGDRNRDDTRSAGGSSNQSDEIATKAAGGAAGSSDSFDCASTSPPGDMVPIPAAEFSMGCNAAVDTECKDDEKPAHAVSLDAFEINRTEVTQGQYAACVTAGACGAPGCGWDCSKGDYPASCVDFRDAKAYCAWASGRLPTEAEWELAARGTDGRKFPWGNQAADCAHVNMAGCGDAPANVGSHPQGASPYAVMDMAGNVVEMVADQYDATYYASSPAKDPQGPASGRHYVGRGGGFKSEEVWQRVSARDTYDTEDASASLGFRCAH